MLTWTTALKLRVSWAIKGVSQQLIQHPVLKSESGPG